LPITVAAIGPPRQLDAAIDGQRAARHIVRSGIGEEQDSAGDLFRPRQSTPGQGFGGALEHFFGEIFSFSRCVGPPRMNDVNANAVGKQFHRGRASHLIDGRLGHVIGHARGHRLDRVGRADDDDTSAVSLSNHLLGRCPEAIKSTPHGHVDGSAKVGHVGRVERRFITVKSVGDEDVQAAEFLDDPGDHGFHSRLVRHVHRAEKCSPAQGVNLRRQFLGPVGMSKKVDRHVGPGSGQS
jgi:hypothetical protein